MSVALQKKALEKIYFYSDQAFWYFLDTFSVARKKSLVNKSLSL